jgi:hypothetical protein
MMKRERNTAHNRSLLGPATTLAQLRAFSPRQWQVAAWSSLAAFLVIGIVGETLPLASLGRTVPVQWWNYVVLVISSPLIGLIAATFVPDGQPQSSRRRGATGAGMGALVGTVAMACPVCSPLAIPLFGAAGLLSFLAPERGLVALLSVGLLAVTLALRLRAAQACRLSLPFPTEDQAGQAPTERNSA